MGSDSYASSARRASRRYGPAAGTIKAPFTALWPVLALLAALAHGAPARAEPITVLAFGDSLTAGYGLSHGSSFPSQLEAALRQRGHQVEVVNAGVSGDTSAGGKARLASPLAAKPAVANVQPRAHDGPPGPPPDPR